MRLEGEINAHRDPPVAAESFEQKYMSFSPNP
jgi:hypothetical protein